MSFDLNIDNYTREELIDIFELPVGFDKSIVEIKGTKLRDSILNNKEINKETQTKTINFILKAKNIILNENSSKKEDNSLKDILIDLYHTSYELKPSQLEENKEHMVQIRKERPFISSSPSNFFPGVINPLKKRTIIQNLNIDTKFRDNYYSSPSTNFNINLPLNIDNVIQMQLNAIELPTSFYVVSKQYNNNYFSINVNDSNLVVKIPDGNYSADTIVDVINQLLVNAGAPFSYISFIANITGSQTGSLQTLVGPNGSGVVTKLELNFQADINGLDDRTTPLPLKFGWNLGFRNGIYVGNTNYVSEGIIDFTGPKYLYLVIDDYNNNVNNGFYSAFNSSILNKNILARISLQANNFNILHQNNLNIVTTPREYFGPVNLYAMNIQLLDEYGQIIDLNNMDFSFCLNLSIVYDL